jgi:hypothetical protein
VPFLGHSLIRPVTFIPDGLIGDPDVGVNGADPTKETVVLSKGSTTVKKQTLTNWGTDDAEFSAGMLSSRAILDWHFKADPNKAMVAPVFMTRFLPTGLNSHNQAAANSTTTVDVSAGRGSQDPDLKFTAATVKHSGSTWQASVHNPASGAVALRSEVTDAAGDRSVETVYRAYAIG